MLTEVYGISPSEIGDMPIEMIDAYLEGSSPDVLTFKTQKDFERYLRERR